MPHVYNYTMYTCDHIIITYVYVHYTFDAHIQHTNTHRGRYADKHYMVLCWAAYPLRA